MNMQVFKLDPNVGVRQELLASMDKQMTAHISVPMDKSAEVRTPIQFTSLHSAWMSSAQDNIFSK